MIKSSFYANAADLPAIQILVKKYDLRFLNNPAEYVFPDGKPRWGAGRIPVDVETTENTDFTAFSRDLNVIIHPPVVEPPTIRDKLRRWFKC